MGALNRESCCFEKKVAVLKINRKFAVGKKYVKPLSLNAMKHEIILLCCLLCSGVMYGQGTLWENTVNGKNNIIRYDNVTEKNITCSHPGGGFDVHFALTDMNSMIDVFVATDLYVKDFEIVDRLVFFCGQTSDYSGFLGWFDIDSLFFLGGSAHIDRNLSTLGLKSLDNIEISYAVRGDIHIAGYGDDLGIPPARYLAFEAVGNTVSGMQYRTLELNQGYDIVDMTLTDNYVVYMEHVKSNECNVPFGIGIYLHPFPKYNMFDSPPYSYYFFETIDNHVESFTYNANPYAYVVPNNDDPHYSVPPVMTHYGEDKIAVCSYRRDLNFALLSPPQPHPCGGNLTPTNTYLTFRMFDLSPLYVSDPIQMTSASLAQLYSGRCISIDAFEYDNMSNHFVVLHRHESSLSNDEHAFTTIDFSTGVPPAFVNSYYQTSFDTRTYWLPNDMCIVPDKQFVVSGEKQNSEYVFWQNKIVPASVTCEQKIPYAMRNIPTMVSKDVYNVNTPTAWLPLLFVWEERIDSIEEENNIICE
jgi:hypothetical protein